MSYRPISLTSSHPQHPPIHPAIQGKKYVLFTALSQSLEQCLDHSNPSIRKKYL